MARPSGWRAERKERTKVELIDAARSVFLRRGFHGASLDEIAEEAGYTKGAVYSNFDGKDDLFLAILGDYFRLRAEAYVGIVFDHDDIEDSHRAVARFSALGGRGRARVGSPHRRVLRPRLAERDASDRRP